MTKDEAITLAKQKMATPVQCQIGGEFYVEMNLRNPRVCPDCQSAYRSAPRWVNTPFNNPTAKDKAPIVRQFLTEKEIQAIKNNSEVVTMRGRFNDVR